MTSDAVFQFIIKCFLSLLLFCILWQGFLHIDEYPPDANQGFDIPSAIVVFADFETHAHINENYSLSMSPLISKLQVMYLFFFYDQYFRFISQQTNDSYHLDQ